MGGTSDVATLAGLVTAAADRLRSLPQSKLTGPAQAGHRLAQWLADAGAGIEGRDAPQPPPRRPVPRLGVFAVGDQVAVTGADLLASASGLHSGVEVWAPDGSRTTLVRLLRAAQEGLRELRSAAR